MAWCAPRWRVAVSTTTTTALAVVTLDEIRTLHAQNIDAAKMTVDRDIRIGELLEGIRAELKHGQWLPWCKAHLPFSDKTARNYIRVFSERDRLKLESVSNLGEAYALLSGTNDAKQESATALEEDDTIPAPFDLLTGKAFLLNHPRVAFALFTPHVQPGFHFVSILEHDSFSDSGSIVGTKRGIATERAWQWFLEATNTQTAEWRDAKIKEYPPEVDSDWSGPWDYHHLLYLGGRQEYVNHAILGRAAA